MAIRERVAELMARLSSPPLVDASAQVPGPISVRVTRTRIVGAKAYLAYEILLGLEAIHTQSIM